MVATDPAELEILYLSENDKMNFKYVALVALTMSTCILPSVQAAGRCPAGESGCTIENAGERIRERVNDGARSVIRNENPEGRAKEVGKTLKDCVKCGMDAVKEGADRISGKQETAQ